MPIRTNRRTVHVGFGDCDPNQIAYYPNYLAWVDESTHRLFESAGLPLRELQEKRHLQVPIVDLRVTFLGPAGWGDDVEIESGIERWGKSSFDVSHAIRNAATQAAIAEARETRVCVAILDGNARTLKRHSIPEDVRTAFQIPGQPA